MIALVLVALVPFVVVLLVQAENGRDRSRRNAAIDTLRLSRLSADRLNSRIRQARALLVGYEASGRVTPDSPTCQAELARALEELSFVTNAMYVGEDGVVGCSAVPLSGTVELSDRVYVQEAIEEAGFAVGPEPAGPLGDRDALVVTLPASDPPGGDLLAVSIDPAAGVDTFFEDLGLPAGSTLEFVDFEGKILGSAPTPATGEVIPVTAIRDEFAAVLFAGTEEDRGLDGTNRIYSYTAVDLTDEHVYSIVGLPTSVAYAEANDDLRTNLIVLGVVALGALALAAMLGEVSVVRRVGAVLSAVRRIGGGDLSARTRMKRTGELGELAGAVDDMATDLQARDQSLRAAAEERERLLGELLDAQEEERRRIAADIHDDTIQAMIATGMQTQLLRRELDQPGQIDRALQLETGVHQAVARLRQLMFELEPATAEEGMEVSLESYLGSVLAGDGADTELEVFAPDAEEPAGATRQVFYRNLREAVLNAARHGEAARIDVRVEPSEGGLLVQVVDDGRGFTDAEARKPGHQGLRTMRDRSEQLGGWLVLDSAPGRGTTVKFWLP